MIKNVYCTKIASKIARTYAQAHGYKDLVRELLNVDISKKQQSSDWSNPNLSKQQIEALDFLDKILNNENNVISYELKSSDFMYSNNSWLIHDRTSFEDYEDENLKRTLIRTWISERGN